MKLYEFLNNCIASLGGKKAFGVPGSYIMPIWQNLGGVDIVTCTSEGDAAYIATGYARATRSLSVLLTTAGPGLTNALSGIASAYRDSLPLVIISGTVSTKDKNKGAFQEEGEYNRAFESTQITQGVTKKSVLINSPHNAAQIIHDAFHTAITDRWGSVHLSIPVDLQCAEIDTKNIQRFSAYCGKRKKINFEQTYQDVSQHKALIIAGWGNYLANSVEAVMKIAEKLSAPIVNTMKAKSCFNSDYPFLLGTLGLSTSKEVIDFLTYYAPRVVLVFGSSLGMKDIANIASILEKTKIYIFDIEDNACEHLRIERKYISNNYESLLASFECGLKSSVMNAGIKKQIKAVKLNEKKSWESKIGVDDLMAKTIRYIDKKVGGNVVVFPDAGNHFLNSLTFFNPKSFSAFFVDAGLAAMGNGICSAIGHAFANPDVRHVCITGDGCCLMNGNSMYVASQYNLNILFVAYNNNSHGRVRVWQKQYDKINYTTDISLKSLQRYSSSLNVYSKAVYLESEFVAAFDDFIKRNDTNLIEVFTPSDETPIILK